MNNRESETELDDESSGLTGCVGEFAQRDSGLDFVIGIKLENRYLVERSIGRGGAGEVFLATDLKSSRKVAIKFATTAATKDESSMKRFRQETRVTRYLRHAKIVKVFEFGIERGHPYFVMEYLSGGSLKDLIGTGQLNEDLSLSAFRQVCEAIHFAHRQGVIHRDIKPNNIMFVDEKHEDLRILDFGISKSTTWDIDKDVPETDGDRFGTPLYFAPERIDGKEADARSDIYSIGCVLYECLAGVPPHVETTATKIYELHKNQDAAPLNKPGHRLCTEKTEHIVTKMLKRRPKDRYQSLEEVLLDLDSEALHKTAYQPATPKSDAARETRLIANLVMEQSVQGAKSKGPILLTCCAILAIGLVVSVSLLWSNVSTITVRGLVTYCRHLRELEGGSIRELIVMPVDDYSNQTADKLVILLKDEAYSDCTLEEGDITYFPQGKERVLDRIERVQSRPSGDSLLSNAAHSIAATLQDIRVVSQTVDEKKNRSILLPRFAKKRL